MVYLEFYVILCCVFVRAEDELVFPDDYKIASNQRTNLNDQQQSWGMYSPAQQADSFTNSVIKNPVGNYAPNRIAANSSNSSRISVSDVLTPFWRNHVNNILSTGILKFALDMDKAVNAQNLTFSDANIIFSPLSLSATMAMVLMASSGQTFTEIAKVLGLESGVDITHHSEIVHQMFGSLIRQLDIAKKAGEPVANYASGIFVQQDYSIRPEFSKIIQDVYQSEIVALDFQRNSYGARDFVNFWVYNKTNGKIPDILSELPDPSTKVIFASALYFVAEWNQHFFEQATKKQQFYIEPNSPVDINMMYNGGEFQFHENQNLGVRILGLPYKGKEVTMYILLPNAAGAQALKNFKQGLSPVIIEQLIRNMRKRTCIFALPRMKLSSTLRLKEALESLGLMSLFRANVADLSILSAAGDSSRTYRNQNSKQLNSSFYQTTTPPKVKRQIRPINEEFINFVNSQNITTFGIDELRNSGTTSNPGLYVDNVIHKVEIEINEKGTEAAAATGVTISRGGNIIRFIVDRPFMFIIRHDPSKLIWFWGTINKP